MSSPPLEALAALKPVALYSRVQRESSSSRGSGVVVDSATSSMLLRKLRS
jgi:hypothetical protein